MSQSQTLIGHIDKYDPEGHYIGKQSTLCLCSWALDLNRPQRPTLYVQWKKFLSEGTQTDGNNAALILWIRATDFVSRITVKAPWISNIHMRLYSIDYDVGMEPFLYVEDASSHGNNAWLYKRQSTWERCTMEKGSIKLLSDGDRLRLCDGTLLRYRSDYAPSASSLDSQRDELREVEKNVGRLSW